MTLMAQVEQARNRHQESNQQLSAASGAMKGIAAATEIERFRLSRSAASIEREVRSAQNARRNLPPAPDGKVYAGAEGRKPILSGLGRRDLIDAVEARAARMNPELFRGAGALDGDAPGRFNFAHAEKMASEAYPNRPLGVSEVMCEAQRRNSGNCLTYFQDLAEHHGRSQVVADPETTRIFHPNSQIDELANDISNEELSRYGREAVLDQVGRETTSSFGNRMGSLSQTVTEGLGSGAGRFASRALGPLGLVLDGVSLFDAWNADGGQAGENFKETAGGVVGGVVGGAAVGAALGSVVPGVGTVIGGVIGGIAGSIGGEWIGGLL